MSKYVEQSNHKMQAVKIDQLTPELKLGPEQTLWVQLWSNITEIRDWAVKASHTWKDAIIAEMTL